MPNFRARTQEIVAQGIADRGELTPHGVPLRIYKFWANHAYRVPRQKNFCHFFWVVVLWAPLMFLRLKVRAFMETKVGQFISGTPASVACFLLEPVFRVADWSAKKWNPKWNKYVQRAGLILLGLLVLTVVVAALITGTMENGWMFLLWAPLTVVGAAAFLFGIFSLGDFLERRTKARREAERKRISEMTNKEYAEWRERMNQPKEPGRVSKFFSGVGDFLILLAQIARVKKWKICPLITIEENK